MADRRCRAGSGGHRHRRCARGLADRGELSRRAVAARLGGLRRDGRRRLAGDTRPEGADRRRDVDRNGALAGGQRPRRAQRAPGARRNERARSQDAQADRTQPPPPGVRTSARSARSRSPRRCGGRSARRGRARGARPSPDLSERWWLIEVEAASRRRAERHRAMGEQRRSGHACSVPLPRRAGRSAVHHGCDVQPAPTGSVAHKDSQRCARPSTPTNPDNPRAAQDCSTSSRRSPRRTQAPFARAKTAIAVHLESDGRAAPLAQYRPSAGGATARGERLHRGNGAATALFAIERAPEPERAESHGAGGGQGLGEARHSRSASAYARTGSARRSVLGSPDDGESSSRAYQRGPVPEDDQIVLTRLAERHGGDQAPESPAPRTPHTRSRRRRRGP